MQTRVLWLEFYHRACEVIKPTKERGPKTLYSFNNRIIIYLCKIINFIKYHQIYVGLLIMIKCFEHQFIPKHRIRIDIAFICPGSFACSRSDIEVAKRPMLDICVTSQPCNKRACNKQACMVKYGNFIEVYNNNIMTHVYTFKT